MLAGIFNTFVNCFKIPELKSRIFFALLLLAVCRLIAIVPIPGLNAEKLTIWFEQSHEKAEAPGLLNMYSMFTGGALRNCAIGSLGIMPYISATIILQLMTAVLPGLSKLARQEGGRAKIVQYGRYFTVLLCLGQGTAMALSWENPSVLFSGFEGELVTIEAIWWYRIQTVLILTTGTLLLMWLGEQITERGIGNGISLVITIGILADLPQAGKQLGFMFLPGIEGAASTHNLFHGVALVLMLVAVTAGVISVTQAQRKIPVQYARRTVGRKVYQGGSSFMPLRVNYAGVMPIIFAQALLMFPEMLLSSLYGATEQRLFQQAATWITYGSIGYAILQGLMILFFSYFWVSTQFNEIQIADDLKKNGGYIPGVRPGQATSDFLHRTMSRITFSGALFLTIIATIPLFLWWIMNVPPIVGAFFGGTSILITVGVILDTMRQIESHLLTRHYDGFMKKGRVRGRF